MATALTVKVAIPSGGNSLDSIPVTDATRRDIEDATSISAFGDEPAAREFLRNNRSKLEGAGFSEDSEIQTLYSTKTGEVIGAYLPKRPPMTSDAASDALDSIL